MRKSIIRLVKGPKIAKEIRARKELYERTYTRESIAQIQTQRFNDVWKKAIRDSPFYRDWAQQYDLPREITDIREVAAFPALKKQHLVEYTGLLLDSESRSFYVSGGSTGEPTRFPKGKDEAIPRYANRVVTYSWLDISPGDRYVHLWGHAHLFGQGKTAVIKEHVRQAKDWLVGGRRLNVYDQSITNIQAWINEIERIDPKFLVGYASALVNLARVIKDRGGTLRVSGLQRIISTAETISAREVEFLENIFGVPVAIEYGAIETGSIAYSRPSVGNGMQILWGSLAANASEEGNLRLSTLDPREFPLINYEIGDQIHGLDNAKQVLAFRSILGRTRDQLSLKLHDGAIGQISIIPIIGALKNIDAVRTVQAAQVEPASAEIYVTANERIDTESVKMVFLGELRKTGVHVDVESITVRQLEEPVKSIAGKVNLIVYRTTI